MFEWLFNADTGVFLGALGFITGLASLIYARSQAKGAHAQVESARKQAAEALLAAELVAKGAREQAAEALLAAERVAKGAREQAAEALRAAELVADGAREQAAEALRAAGLVAENARVQAVQAVTAAGLVAENARVQAVQALTAAGLVAENARLQAAQAVRAAELVANSAVSARVREMRARNFEFNPSLPAPVKAMMKDAGGPGAYGLLLDAIDIGQEIYLLRKGGVVSDDHWRVWMNDQIRPMASSTTFKAAFRHAVEKGSLSTEFSNAFEAVFAGRAIKDPWGNQVPIASPRARAADVTSISPNEGIRPVVPPEAGAPPFDRFE